METEKGVSIIEIIFAIGVTVIVIAGVVSLMVKSTGTKTNSLQRKKASEVAEMVIEDLMKLKNSSSNSFWDLGPISDVKDNYNYNVEFVPSTVGTCRTSPPWTCTEATITIDLGASQSLVVKRFFSKTY
jgi:Tfp pilus assembly protein PilV